VSGGAPRLSSPVSPPGHPSSRPSTATTYPQDLLVAAADVYVVGHERDAGKVVAVYLRPSDLSPRARSSPDARQRPQPARLVCAHRAQHVAVRRPGEGWVRRRGEKVRGGGKERKVSSPSTSSSRNTHQLESTTGAMCPQQHASSRGT